MKTFLPCCRKDWQLHAPRENATCSSWPCSPTSAVACPAPTCSMPVTTTPLISTLPPSLRQGRGKGSCRWQPDLEPASNRCMRQITNETAWSLPSKAMHGKWKNARHRRKGANPTGTCSPNPSAGKSSFSRRTSPRASLCSIWRQPKKSAWWQTAQRWTPSPPPSAATAESMPPNCV